MAAPDEIIGATAGAFEVVDRIELYVNRYFARKDVAADNIGVHSRLVEQHEAALQLIAVIVHNRAFHRVSLVPVYDEYIRSRLHSMRSQLQTNAERLKTLSVEINKAGVMTRVWRVNNILENCGKDIAEFHSFLTGTVIPLLRESDPSDQSVSEQYVPGSNVPPNPPRLTFDYNTKETCEGRLKAAILEGSSSGVVGIVASGLGGVGKTCALRGLAKDTDIRERFADGIFYIQLGNDVRISDVVNGLADAVETTGGNQLSRKVRRSPTVLEASKKANPWFKPRKCLFLVDDIWWVNGITSTVFEDLGIVLHDESLLVYTTRDKRFLRGADKKVSFEARAARGYIAERMLRTHAGLGTDVELSSESREAFDGILNICRGLPLAIGVAGATVSMYENRRKMNTEEAWLCYYRNLITKEENIIGERADRYGELRLIVDSSLDVLSTERRFSRPLEEMFRGFCILRKQQRVTGQVLQKLWNLVELREARQVAEKFDEVSLLQITESWNAFYVQLHDLVLEIAWHTASYRNEVKGWFGTLIDNYFPNGQDGNVEHGSALDDVTRDPSRLRRDFNRCLRVLRTWTRLCFSRNQPDIQKVAETSGRECAFRPWWSIDDDGFIHDNLCRALQRSGQEKELLWLLERARWVVIRLQKGGIGGVDDDLGIGLRVAKKNAVDGTEIVRYLKLIGSAARLSFMAVVENAYESWFQMYARVAWFANHCPRTQKFLSEICEHAPRPWVKPSVGFLDQAGGLVLETLHVKGCVAVLSICHGGDMIRILWIDSDGVGFVTDYEKRYGSRETHMLGSVQVRNNSSGNGQNAVSVQDGTSSESDRCMCGAFSDDLKTLVTGYSYILFTESDKSIAGKVLVWDIAAGFKIKNFLQTPCDAHKVGISGSGRKVACSLKDGRIFVWDTYRETGAGNPLEVLKVDEELKTLQLSYDGNRLLCCSDLSSNEGFYVWDSDYGRELVLPGEMQSDDVQCAAISRDSRLVVSGSMDGTIRIWNVDSTERAVHIINGHALVREIVLTPDGKRILSCADDHTMRVWDAESLVMIGQPLEMVWINRVAVSADGNEVVFNVSVDTIRVFSIKNMDTTIRSESYLGRVNCVAWRGRGKRLVTGSRDGFVRMWDAESGVRIGQPLEGHTRAVVCVAVSADGNRIVCGSEDGFVRIWDAISREAVAEPFSPVEGDEASSIASVAVNESGTRVVFCFRGRIYLWDVDGGGARTVTRDARHDSCVAISADGARLAFFSSVVSATVWDVDTKGSTVVGLTLSGHTGYLRSVTFSGDGKRLVCGSWDGTVRVWDVTSGEAIGEPFAHDYQVVHLQSDVHGSRVASYDNRGNGKLWDVTRREYVMTSFDDEWASTLHSLEVEDISWNVQPTEFWKVVGRIGVKHEQTLASTERCLVRVGDIYYSEAHGSAFWPSCRIVR